MIKAEVLADSVSVDHNGNDVRLTTLLTTFPRFILAEMNTHRMLSKNSASSRAIPPEKQVERIRRGKYFVPVFGSRVTGMGQGDKLSEDQQYALQSQWRMSALQAADDADRLLALGGDKSHINRILEPYLWHTAIISGTEWKNFFNLRIHPAAQPEIRQTAKTMLDAILGSTPRRIGVDLDRTGLPVIEWHLPLISEEERKTGLDLPMASAGRCARVSYEAHEKEESLADSAERARTLGAMAHWSPFEHPAMTAHSEMAAGWGNYQRPWFQLRKCHSGEAIFGG